MANASNLLNYNAYGYCYSFFPSNTIISLLHSLIITHGQVCYFREVMLRLKVPTSTQSAPSENGRTASFELHFVFYEDGHCSNYGVILLKNGNAVMVKIIKAALNLILTYLPKQSKPRKNPL